MKVENNNSKENNKKDENITTLLNDKTPSEHTEDTSQEPNEEAYEDGPSAYDWFIEIIGLLRDKEAIDHIMNHLKGFQERSQNAKKALQEQQMLSEIKMNNGRKWF